MAPEPSAAPPRRRRRAGLWLHVALALISAGALLAAVLRYAGQAEATEAAREHRPIEVNTDGYVSSKQCRSCHLEQYQSWHDSYHRTMTQPATPQTVFGDFSDVTLRYQGLSARLLEEDGRYYAEIDPLPGVLRQPGRESGRVPIVLVTGSHHMQVYWYETGRGRALGQLPFLYLRDEARWIPRTQAFIRPPGKLRPSETGRWNQSCIHCHTTHGQPRLAPGLAGGEGLDTRVAEFGIACEACHGPAREHLVQHSTPWSRYAGYFDEGRDPSIVNPARLDHRAASQICSQCHGIYQFRKRADERRADRTGYPFRPGEPTPEALLLFHPPDREGDPLLDRLIRENPHYTAGQFWPDGMARVSGREFNGMIESACYQRGEMSCMSCHDMHREHGDPRTTEQWANDQLAASAEGDGGCTQCHQDLAERLSEHTKHTEDSAGSRCYNCHMPHTSYGLLKAMRTHQVTSPDAAVAQQTGRPTACNLCHLDKSLGWTAAKLSELYGADPATLSPDEQTLSAAALLAVRGDAAQRALIAWSMGWQPAQEASGADWLPAFLGLLMDDPYDGVRLIAHRSLNTLGDFEKLQYDSIPAPSERPAVAARVAAMAQEQGLGGAPPPGVPLSATGELGAEVERLLKERDNRAVDLLE